MCMFSLKTEIYGEEAGIEAYNSVTDHPAIQYKGMSPSVPILFLLCLKWIHLCPWVLFARYPSARSKGKLYSLYRLRPPSRFGSSRGKEMVSN